MIILQVIPHTDRRGGPVFALDLEEGLRGRGRDVRTVALAPGTDERPLPAATLGAKQFGVRTLLALRREIGRSSVVIAQGSSALPATAFASFASGTPFVYRTVGEPLYWARTPSRRLRTKAFLRRARMIVALWPSAADTLAEKLGIPRDRIRVIPRAVPTGRFPLVDEQERRAARRSLGIIDDEKVACFIGSLTSEKRIEDAIRAVARTERFMLVVAGTGPLQESLQSLANSLAPRRVMFLGSTERPSPALAGADVFILPSETEGTPGALLEASLRGIPSVATPVGAIPQMVVEGRTGHLVRVGDVPGFAAALERTVSDGRALGARARAHCLKHFDFERIVDAWDDLLMNVAARTGFRRDGEIPSIGAI